MNDLCPKVGVAPDEAAAKSPAPAKKPPEKAAPASEPPTKAAPAPVSGALSLAEQLPEDWRRVLAAEFTKPYFAKLEKYVAAERKTETVFPPVDDVFNAFRYTPYDQVKVLLLGQDPYHDDGQAHGLCFSVRPGVKTPPSLVNMYKELQTDLGCKPVQHGHLTAWARQGVMLLNAVLTVRAHNAASHKGQGWETFTDAVIRALNARTEPVVFLLWGAYAQKKQELIDTKKHAVLAMAHPSPLSVKKFFGSRPFSKANAALEKFGVPPIDWQLPATPDAVDGKSAPKPVTAPATNRTTAPVTAPPAEPVAPVQNSSPATRLSGFLPACWRSALSVEFGKPYFQKLEKFLDVEREEQPVVPEEKEVFAAFRLTPLAQVRVVLLGDEPPCTAEDADGLAFSTRPGRAPTPALTAIFQELRRDLGCRIPTTGCLAPWARQGVLLLNEVLTVREAVPGSHGDCGWERFTDAVLRVLNARPEPVVFLLWGEVGERKRGLIDAPQHAVLTPPHPEDADFAGSRPFSAVNEALELRRRSAVHWQLFSV
jgi:uracil-DNA glycosylase